MTRKKTNLSEAFEGLNEVFDTSFVETECPDKEELLKTTTENLPISRQCGIIVSDIEAGTDIVVEDVEYLELEIKGAVESIDVVMDKMEQDIKIGSPPRMYEAYSALANAKVGALKELFNFRKGIADTKIKAKYLLVHNDANKIKEKAIELKAKQKEKPNEVNINTINITSKELLALTKEAQDNSELNALDVDFDVSDSVSNDGF